MPVTLERNVVENTGPSSSLCYQFFYVNDTLGIILHRQLFIYSFIYLISWQEDEWTRCMDCTLNQGRSPLAARRRNEEGDQRTSLQIKLKGRTDGGTSLK